MDVKIPHFNDLSGICRLCLSYNPDIVNNLFQNSELMTKFSSCFLVELPQEKHLPILVCLSCITKINDAYAFQTKICQSQKILIEHHNLGVDSMKQFYGMLKNIKIESENEYTNGIYCKNDVKSELEETHLNNIDDYSSDDNLTLFAVKKNKEKCQEPWKLKTKTSKEKKQKPKDIWDTKENLKTEESVTSIDNNFTNTDTSCKCLTCFNRFASQQSLLKHYKTAHGPKENIKTIKKEIGREYVKEEENGVDVFRCRKCSKAFSTRKKVQSHLHYTHITSRPYVCNICGRTYKVASDIVRHGRAHGGGVTYTCSFKCGYETPYRAGLRSHEERHREEYRFTCAECGKGFQVRTWFEEHRNQHSGARPFGCDLCPAAFQLKRYLVKHLSTAHPQAAPLQRYACACGAPCGSARALRQHRQDEHGMRSSFLCDICGKTFTKSVKLALHKAFHLNIRPHACSICKKCFTTRDHLKRHQLCVHAGQRRHACEECGKRYSQSHTLNVHKQRSYDMRSRLSLEHTDRQLEEY